MGYFCDPVTGGPVHLDLRSVNGEEFRLLGRIGYVSDRYADMFVAPDDLETFRTDLASVPAVLRWFVPRSGPFLPAAVLHDAMVEPGIHYLGPRVTRREADAIFREALVELGTGVVRARLMWAAVVGVTMRWGDPTDPAAPSRGSTRARLVVSAVVVTLLGLLLTLDAADVLAVLPGMGERALAVELLVGGAWMLGVAALAALTWGRDAAAGFVAALTYLAVWPVVAGATLVLGVYLGVERLVSGPVTDGRRRAPGDAKARRQSRGR